MKGPPSRSLVDILRHYLRDKCLLLLLDNFEHLLPAALLVGELLATCEQLTVLVTSRAVLHLAAEHEYTVAPITAWGCRPSQVGIFFSSTSSQGAVRSPFHSLLFESLLNRL